MMEDNGIRVSLIGSLIPQEQPFLTLQHTLYAVLVPVKAVESAGICVCDTKVSNSQ